VEERSKTGIYIYKILDEKYRSLSSSIWSFIHSPVTSSILGPNIPLNTPFSNTLSLCCSLDVGDHVSHSYKTRGKIVVLYILIVFVLGNKLEGIDSAPNDGKYSLISICP
jgi:hypothetical protein